jgi:hypothetical protein
MKLNEFVNMAPGEYRGKSQIVIYDEICKMVGE